MRSVTQVFTMLLLIFPLERAFFGAHSSVKARVGWHTPHMG